MLFGIEKLTKTSQLGIYALVTENTLRKVWQDKNLSKEGPP